VTAGNASGINDGAAALVVASDEYAGRTGAPVLARIVSSSVAGVEPMVMGMGPVPAARTALARAGLGIADIDLFELNAFAVQSLAVARELDIDPARYVNGAPLRWAIRLAPAARIWSRSCTPSGPAISGGARGAVHRRRHGHRRRRRARLTPGVDRMGRTLTVSHAAGGRPSLPTRGMTPAGVLRPAGGRRPPRLRRPSPRANVDASPVRYTIDPRAYLRASREARASGLDVIGATIRTRRRPRSRRRPTWPKASGRRSSTSRGPVAGTASPSCADGRSRPAVSSRCGSNATRPRGSDGSSRIRNPIGPRLVRAAGEWNP
jgi:hypothetical protein